MIEIILIIGVVIETMYIIHLKFKESRHDGQMFIDNTDDGKKIFSLNLEGDPMELVNKPSVTFKVVPHKEL
jgi:hypothetical protein